MNVATPSEVNRAVILDLKARGESYQMVSDTIGKSKQIIANQLSSDKRFSKQMAMLFSKAYGYSIHYLLFGEGTLMSAKSDDTGDVPAAETDKFKTYTGILTSLVAVAEDILYAIGDKDAIEAWRKVTLGDFQGYREAMERVFENNDGARVNFITARFLCETINESGLFNYCATNFEYDASKR